MRDFNKPCKHCGSNSIEIILPKNHINLKTHPYLKKLPEYCCKSCIIKAQINYIKGVPLEDTPLLLNMYWIYPEGMQEKINERLGFL